MLKSAQWWMKTTQGKGEATMCQGDWMIKCAGQTDLRQWTWMWIFIAHNNISNATMALPKDCWQKCWQAASLTVLVLWLSEKQPSPEGNLGEWLLMPISLWIKWLRNHSWNHVLMMMDEFTSHQKCVFDILSWPGGLEK